ncbi:PREDICTED: zinc finger protein ZFPM1 [Chrysochloris asiatica]|uniref:Zinc finger protein ZFPM1 n=1 Tax=Chrysochloris asiatica TaxID=185453 RepID=A0A9B0TGP0_CHRAS|nr:PREDICTED: zinc finger protein ZFPM1 [Chrysochloris asiatica]
MATLCGTQAFVFHKRACHGPLSLGGSSHLGGHLESTALLKAPTVVGGIGCCGSFGDMEAGEEAQTMDSGLTEGVATAPEPEPSGEPEPPSPSRGDTEPPPPLQPTPTFPGGPEKMEGQEPETRPQETSASAWNGPDELEPALQEDGRQCVRARRSLTEGSSWGPFRGTVQSRASPPRQGQSSPPLTLQLEDQTCWLRTLPQATTEAEANSLIYWKDEALWCRLTKLVPAGGLLSVRLSAEPQSAPTPLPVKREQGEAEGQAPAHTDIQLLPQQAGMASILATAVINRDIFPCKDCGIWYRSERNLQAHLLYYCASRQSACSPAASEDKPKETYPNERVCPFPQCRKSCPSASSLEIHMRSHSGERPFVCLICLSAFTTKANCERHLKVHTDTLSGICHSCGFISTTRDILYSHLVTSHMICQPGCKGELYSVGYPTAKIPADSLAGFPQPAALPGALATADLVPTRSPGLERKPLMETTNGEACAAPQNGGEPPAPRDIKVEAEEEPEAEQASSPAPRAPSRTPSPHSLPTLRVKAERTSPSPACSPAPGELGAPTGPLFLPQFVFGADAVPQASEILAKMSELVHSRLKQGQGAPGLFPGTPAPKGATCFECEITFNNINNYYVHKRLYCSGRHQAEDVPGARRPKGPAPAPAPAPHGSQQTAPSPPLAPETDAGRSPPSPDARDEETSSGPGAQAATPEAEAAGRGSEGSQSPGSSVDDAEDDPSRTLCEACNIRFSRHETYTVHKRYYCASRHDPPPRRPPATTASTGGQPTVRTRRRRKLYELHTPGAPPPPASGPAHPLPAEQPVSPGPADGPIDLSKKPRRHGPETAPGPPPPPPPPLPLADYHECTACRVSFHSLDAYLTHKKFSCPAAQLRGLRAPDDAPPAAAVVCPYCPTNGLVRGDLLQHLRRAHGLLVGRPEARTPPASPPPRVPRDSLNGQESAEPAAGSPLPGPPASPAATPARGLSPVPAPPAPPSDQGAHTPGKGPPAPVPNGNARYCRLCNIKFSSLSTFIAHKKYYCSSHAAEHVK